MLTDTNIRKIKPGTTTIKRSDGGGMFIEVKPNGSRYWRMNYRFEGKQKTMAFGVYPAVTLADARQRRADAKRLLANGIDPNAAKKAAKVARAVAAAAAQDTFENVARAWVKYREDSGETSAATIGKDLWRLEGYLFPAIGSRPIAEITAKELRDVLRGIEEKGKAETASRTKITAGQVFRWAILEGKTETDPTAPLRRQFTTPTPTHRAAITDPAKIGELMRAIHGYTGRAVTLAALKLAPLVFVRPGELRAAEWAEVDLEGALWRIPAERMKMKQPHLVPLSTQAVEILRELQGLTGDGRYVFPALGKPGTPMSEAAVLQALKRLGYSGSEMTGHGFRSMAATRLNEMGWNADAVERQLAHAEPNKVRAAYTSAAQYLEERTRMMQAWADYLDGLRTGAKVIPINRKAG